jgi:FixJ family two-component response regulator
MIPLHLRSPLSEQQEYILQKLADGETQKEIAFEMGLNTIKYHLYGDGSRGRPGVLRRTGQSTVAAAVAEAVRNMWIT